MNKLNKYQVGGKTPFIQYLESPEGKATYEAWYAKQLKANPHMLSMSDDESKRQFYGSEEGYNSFSKYTTNTNTENSSAASPTIQYTPEDEAQRQSNNKAGAYKEISDVITDLYKKNNRTTFSDISQSGENEYQFNAYTPNGNFDFSNGFKIFNTAAQTVTGFANFINDQKQRKQENEQYIKALQPRANYNINEQGINNIPIYKGGGSTNRVDMQPLIPQFNTQEPYDKYLVPKGMNKLSKTILLNDDNIDELNKLHKKLYNNKNNDLKDYYNANKSKGNIAINLAKPPYINADDKTLFNELLNTGNQLVSHDGGTLLNTMILKKDKPNIKGTPIPVQSTNIPEQTGKPVYGPGSTIIGYVDNNRNFKKAYSFTGSEDNEHNLQDKYLLEDEDALRQYVRSKESYSFQEGGDAYSPFGRNKINFSELEKGEVYEDTNGEIQKIPETANTHEDGGAVVDDASRVLQDTSDKRTDYISKLLKLRKSDIDYLNKQTGYKVKNAKTHSKYFEKASEQQDKEMKSLQKKLSNNLEYAKSTNSPFANNSLDLNIKMLESQKTKQDLFDEVFTHQELLKQNIQQEEEAKYGGYYDKMKDGGKARPGKTTKDNVDYTEYDDKAKQELSKFYQYAKSIGYTGSPTDVKAIQDFVFEKQHPELSVDYAKRNELTNKGRTTYNTDTASDLTPEQLRDQLVDGKFWRRYFTTEDRKFRSKEEYDKFITDNPSVVEGDTKYYPQAGATADDPFKYINPSYEPLPTMEYNTSNTGTGKANVPLSWKAIATDVYNLVDSGRHQVRYDGVNLKTPTIHLQDYRPQLAQGNADYNTILDMVPQTGVGQANLANVFSSKYAIDNQIVANTEAANKNKMDALDSIITQTQNAQQLYDFNSRQSFDMRYKKSLENQRLQRLVSTDNILSKSLQNDAFNNNLNLLLQATPHYNEDGTYNGKAYEFQKPQKNNQI